MNFDFATASRIVFGPGKINDIGDMVSGMGRQALICTGSRAAEMSRLTDPLEAAGVSWVRYIVPGEPTIPFVEDGVYEARSHGCDIVIGFGGGSALDTAKAVSAMLTNPGNLLDYLEVVGQGQAIKNPPVPFVAVPTTAGTGSEVTRNAVIGVPDQHVKVSLRSPMMLARLALIDPELTHRLPPQITAATGMDALAQVFEPYVSRRANAMTDLWCLEGMRRASSSLKQAYQNGSDSSARENMAFASLMGGLALANAGLGAVHGFAGPIGGMFDAPHGAVCAALLPPVVQINTRALKEREPGNPALRKYEEVASIVTGKQDSSTSDLIDWLYALRLDLAIPSLRPYGVRSELMDILVEKSASSSSMKSNPITLTSEELREILDLAM